MIDQLSVEEALSLAVALHKGGSLAEAAVLSILVSFLGNRQAVPNR